jgi:hypothetical protein
MVWISFSDTKIIFAQNFVYYTKEKSPYGSVRTRLRSKGGLFYPKCCLQIFTVLERTIRFKITYSSLSIPGVQRAIRIKIINISLSIPGVQRETLGSR